MLNEFTKNRAIKLTQNIEFNNFINVAVSSYIRSLNFKIVETIDKLSEETWHKENSSEKEKEDLFLQNIEFLDNVDLLGEAYLAKIKSLAESIYSNSNTDLDKSNNFDNSFATYKKLNDNYKSAV